MVNKCIKILKVAAYVSEVIVASSIVMEMIEKFRSRKADPTLAVANPATPDNLQPNPA